MTPIIDLQIVVAETKTSLPSTAQFNKWVDAALAEREDPMELTIRIVDKEESQDLNSRYRNKFSPTNVLSFPSELPDEINIPLLGDLVICADIVAEEAQQQNKSCEAHWAHMVIHGTLHLLGYDHNTDEEADIMEGLETRILTGLQYPPPYSLTETIE